MPRIARRPHAAWPVLLAAGFAAAHAQTPPPAPPAPPPPAATEADVEARLEAARDRLEAAAREVAELSMESSGPIERQIRIVGPTRPAAIIGVQLDSAATAEGARVQQVSPGGAAAEAGVVAGDIITQIDGRSLKGLDQGSRALIEFMRDVKPDQKLRLKVARDGRTRDVVVVARAAPPMAMPLPGPGWSGALPPLPPGAPPPMMRERRMEWRGPDAGVAGMELATLTPTLGAYFGTEKGVLVVRAPRDAAWKLLDGDVLLSIDGREPSSGQHATRILRSYQAGEQLKLRVMRQKKAADLQVKVPEADPGAVRMRARAPD